MKKITFIFAYLFASIFLTAQAAMSFTQLQISQQMDSTQINVIANTAFNLATVLNGGAQFIPGVNNEILHTFIFSGVLAFFYRWREKKKLRKKGVLLDKGI